MLPPKLAEIETKLDNNGYSARTSDEDALLRELNELGRRNCREQQFDA
jgi:hypothetical protein